MDINGVDNISTVNTTVTKMPKISTGTLGVNRDVSTGQENQNFTKEDVDKAVDKFNKVAEDEGIYAEYEIHDKFNQVMIKIIDRHTKDVILEIPPKKILDMVAKMCEMVGILVDKRA